MKKKKRCVAVEETWYNEIIQTNAQLQEKIVELSSHNYYKENQRIKDELHHLRTSQYLDNLSVQKCQADKFAMLIDCCEFFYAHYFKNDATLLVSDFLDKMIPKYNIEEVQI